MFHVLMYCSYFMKVLHQLLLKLKWNYVAIVYDDDNYGRPMALELRHLSQEKGICVPVFVSLPLDSRSVSFETTVANIVEQVSFTYNFSLKLFEDAVKSKQRPLLNYLNVLVIHIKINIGPMNISGNHESFSIV